MHLTHHRRPRPRREGWLQHPERGYTTAMTAFLLVPMMIFAGFAVDVGSWYTRALEIQRAADAAALAGVVWLPGDFPRAEIEARAVASRNGFTNGVDNIQVSVQEVLGKPQELDVIITDTRVETMFGAVVKSHISLTRSAPRQPLQLLRQHARQDPHSATAAVPAHLGALHRPWRR
jgi:hypothetical protein